MRSSISGPALRFMILLKPGRMSTGRELSCADILEPPCRVRGIMTPGLPSAWRVHGVVYARSRTPVTEWVSCAGKQRVEGCLLQQRRLMKLRFLLFLGSLGLFCWVPSMAAQAGQGALSASSLVAAASPADEQPAAQGPTLSLADAEARALHNQPRLAAETLRAQAMGKAGPANPIGILSATCRQPDRSTGKRRHSSCSRGSYDFQHFNKGGGRIYAHPVGDGFRANSRAGALLAT